MKTATLISLAAALTISTSALAANPPQGEPGPHPGPPPPDTQSCASKQAGDVVTVTTPDGNTVEGTCQLVLILPPPPKCTKN